MQAKQLVMEQVILSFPRLCMQLSIHSCPVWHNIEPILFCCELTEHLPYNTVAAVSDIISVCGEQSSP